MNKIEFLMENCIGCGLCSKICGSSVIKMRDKFPYIDNDEICCSCGHCAAICPKRTIYSNNVGNYRSFKINEFDTDLSIVEKLLKNKRSVRIFKSEVPDKDTIRKIIEYAEKAPSSTNNRHRKYIVLTDINKIDEIEKSVLMHFTRLGKIINPLLIGMAGLFSKKLASDLALTKSDITHMKSEYDAGEKPIFKNTPVLILIAAPKGDIQAKDDCIIAQQYMMLYAESIGIGSCINGYAQFAHKSVEKLLELPSGYVIYSAGIFGYSKYTFSSEIIYDSEPEIIWI